VIPRATQDGVVSSEDEALIRVDSSDRPIGTLDKSACHDGAGLLHRAFSLFIFNPKGELLIHKRHPSKRLWPAYWSNSCCSHPRAGEDMTTAVGRRLQQELGLTARLQYLYKFEYRAEFGVAGTEHELCWVYVGTTPATPVINTTEIAEWRWIAPEELFFNDTATTEIYTPWFKLEWARLQSDFSDVIRGFCSR